ncbi:MAG: nucleotidyltransferase domain-containing protein, partial [Bernardetiaceae bacterium]|nr:nucleotidyltransferase domain-containing protein [Bernardetiaceae bacterium]
MVSQRHEIFKLLEQCKPQILGFGVSKIGLFGSFARSEQHSDSDIDFWVEFLEGKKTYKNFINLAYFLDDITGRKT